MTDTFDITQLPGIDVRPEAYTQIREMIADIDVKLDAGSDAGKRAIINQAAKEFEDNWKPLLLTVVEKLTQLKEDHPDVLAGALQGITSGLNESFKKEVDAWAEAQVSTNEAETLTEAQKEQLLSQRKNLVNQANQVWGMLTLLKRTEGLTHSIPKKTGAFGKRITSLSGKKFQFAIDGKDREGASNSLSSITAAVCVPLGWRTADMYNFLKKEGVNLEDPPDTFNTMLPDPVNKKLSWRKLADGEAQEDAPEADEVEGEEEEE